MNRRTFLKAVAVAGPAASVGLAAAPEPVPFRVMVPRQGSGKWVRMPYWMQTVRHQSYCSEEYLAELERVMRPVRA